MDPTQQSGGANGQPQYPQPQYPQPQYGPGPQGTVVPLGQGWAPGVHPMPVSRRSHRLRWAIAGAAVLCVAIITAASVFVLSGATGAKSLTASVAPKNAIAFVEVRSDLPGDQRTKLSDFLRHFPGFQDRAQFDTALDALLNKLTSSISPDLTYTSAFKPWMEGEVSIAVMNLGTVGSSSSSAASISTSSAVVIFTLKDRAAAESWLASELSRQKLTTTSGDYAGTKLYTAGSGAVMGAYAFTDQDLLLGTVDGVKAALDTKTKGSLADNANYQAAMKSFSGESLARFYLDPKALVAGAVDSYNAAIKQVSGRGSPIPTIGISGAAMPAWIAGSVRAESDRMVVDMAYPRPTDASAGNHVSRLASALPGNTVAALEVHSLGKLVTDGLAALEAQSSGNSTLQTVKTVMGLIGGVDWLGDGVAVVTKDGSNLGGGLVVEATDASTASAKVSLISNAATLAGFVYKISSHDETYKGVTITLIDIPASMVGIPLRIAVAAKGNLIVAGYGDAFVKAFIDTTSATSLASQSDYSALMAAVGSSNQQSFYVNIPALVDEIGRALFQVSPSTWTQNYKPYFDSLGSVSGAVVDGNTVILRLVVMAK